MSKRDLSDLATRLLRQAGYRADGRPRGSVAWDQTLFERRVQKQPISGRSRRLRH